MSLNILEEKLPIINYSEAKAIGLKQYYTGIPCKHGHICKRDVSDRSCYECKLIKSAKWKKLNPEKHSEINIEWAKNNKQKISSSRIKLNSKDPKKYWARSCFQNARKRAAKQGVAFDLTVDDIYNLAGDCCPVFGFRFNFIGNGRIGPESPSLDKIDPSAGYVLGNVAVISMKANMIKQNASSEEIRKVADWLNAQGKKYVY